MGLTQNGLAAADPGAATTDQRASVRSESASMTADTDLRLARYFGVSRWDSGFGLQADHDLLRSATGRFHADPDGSRRIGAAAWLNVPNAAHSSPTRSSIGTASAFANAR